jgi:hypothetical protein
VRQFVNTNGCYRIASYKIFDPQITALHPSHYCCDYCAATCACTPEGCSQPPKPFEEKVVKNTFEYHQSRTRTVSHEEKQILSESLEKITECLFAPTMSPFGITSTHGFSQELIFDVVSNCHRIFTKDDIYQFIPVFSKIHAAKILGILNEIFDDINESSLISEMAHDQRDTVQRVTGLDELINTSDYLKIGPQFEDLDVISDD